MDMYMPQCNGQELAKLIRQVPDYLSLPIVYLSGETDLKNSFRPCASAQKADQARGVWKNWWRP